MSDVRTVLINPAELSPHPENYNIHPQGQVNELAESLEIFGQFKNIVVWSPDETIPLGDGRELHPDVKYILAGHGLWSAAMGKGLEAIEIKDYTGLPYEDALLLMKVDNAAPYGAEIDRERLGRLMAKTKGLLEDRPQLKGMMERLREREGIQVSDIGVNKGHDSELEKIIASRFLLVIECDGESQQIELLERFSSEGILCRALIS